MNIKNKIIEHEALIKYLSYSVFVTVIDVLVAWILMKFNMSLVLSNTIAVIVGFIIHYLLSSKSVFNADYGAIGFAVYFITFIIGLVSADSLIYVSYHYVFFMFNDNINFLMSKCVSIVTPFFIMYFIRKYAYSLIEKKGGSKS